MEASLGSYPPAFRPSQARVEPEAAGGDDDGSAGLASIPIIDLEEVGLEGQVGEACREWGAFRLVNHGVPTGLLGELEEQIKKLFGLPFETKQGLAANPISSYFWGTPALTPSGAALSRGNRVLDWVEGFSVPIGRLPQLHHPNSQLQDSTISDSLRLQLKEYGGHMARIARRLYEAMAKNLGLDEELGCRYLAESSGALRVYRYPRHRDATTGLNEHTDSSVVAILSQDHVGGLQLLKDGAWLTVQPIPDTLIVNLGDMMQAISDDGYKSVRHRVVANRRQDRISLCYFAFPSDDGLIRSSRYRPFTYGEFRAKVQQDVRDLGFKLGLQHFKLPGSAH